MSLCYDREKWTMISLASVAISLTFGLVSLAYGQNTSSSMVDKLIEDTKKGESYKAELINRIQNSTCTQNFLPNLNAKEEANIMSPDDARKYNDYRLGPDPQSLAPFIMSLMDIEHLEEYFKTCVSEGQIK